MSDVPFPITEGLQEIFGVPPTKERDMALTHSAELPAMPGTEELGEVIEATLDELDKPSEPTVHDADSADWALRKLAQTRKKLAAVSLMADKQRNAIYDAIEQFLTPINEWQDQQSIALSKELAFFESLLLQYHRSLLKEDPKAKTVTLPHGALVARKLPDQWGFGDEFLSWAKDNAPELVRVKNEEEVNRIEAKKTLSIATTGDVVYGGELVPGVRWEPGEIRFSVDTEETF